MRKLFIIFFVISLIVSISANASENIFSPLKDKYDFKKDYFDYSVILTEFPKNFYYTTTYFWFMPTTYKCLYTSNNNVMLSSKVKNTETKNILNKYSMN